MPWTPIGNTGPGPYPPAPVLEWTPLSSIRGPAGPPGPPGAPGGSFAYRQETPAATWEIAHGLDRKPSPTLFDDTDPTEPVVTDVFYPDLDTIIVEWPEPTSGWAYL